jgi:pimeloyl-ACP methyl ester carboxylesterase
VAFPDPIFAGIDDLPRATRGVLNDPPEATDRHATADGIPFACRSWGDLAAPPLLLLHGVTASSRIWWRVGPAVATALDRYVLAPDLPGHGRTGHWAGRVPFRDNAGSIAALIRAVDFDRPDLRIVGHSWGAMTAAALPSVGVVPEVLVLLDPPAVSLAQISSMLDDPVERRYEDLDEAIAAVGRLHPTWSWGDVVGKAEALTQFDEAAVRAVLTENGDWDGGLAALSEPAADGLCVRLVRGEVATGGLVPDPAAEAIARRIGDDNVVTIGGGSHSPMRQRIEATIVGLLRALEPC